MSPGKVIRLGAVTYLNARPLVFGLDRSPRFAVRFDIPSRCATLLHEGAIDVCLIPSIEYLRGGPYCIVPDLAIASRGKVASVALYTTKPMADVRSVVMDTSSRTSAALVRVLCRRQFKIEPTFELGGPDLEPMLKRCDAALIIGDNALFVDPEQLTVNSRQSTANRERSSVSSQLSTVDCQRSTIEKIDLGEVWTNMTGLPFVYAFWAGRPGALTSDDVETLQRTRDAGVAQSEDIARKYFSQSLERQAIGAEYLRDNVKYYLGDEERAGLELFYRYAADAGVAPAEEPLRFY